MGRSEAAGGAGFHRRGRDRLLLSRRLPGTFGYVLAPRGFGGEAAGGEREDLGGAAWRGWSCGLGNGKQHIVVLGEVYNYSCEPDPRNNF